MTDTPEPFHTFDYFGNEYVIERGNVPTDAPTVVTLWPLAMWRTEANRRRASSNVVQSFPLDRSGDSANGADDARI